VEVVYRAEVVHRLDVAEQIKNKVRKNHLFMYVSRRFDHIRKCNLRYTYFLVEFLLYVQQEVYCITLNVIIGHFSNK